MNNRKSKEDSRTQLWSGYIRPDLLYKKGKLSLLCSNLKNENVFFVQEAIFYQDGMTKQNDFLLKKKFNFFFENGSPFC